ncbi:MAG TPA: hypothetical protein VEU30_04510 [Thermoanaerobaculia bacterium]|nr:hypothetical protein [Thermoanaerobaculia bacterium]
MAEAKQEQPSDKPGFGIDRTVIRDLLTLTPGERMKLVDNDAEVLAAIDRVAQQLRRK